MCFVHSWLNKLIELIDETTVRTVAVSALCFYECFDAAGWTTGRVDELVTAD